MSSFTKPLLVKVLDDGSEYEVLEDFMYYRSEKNTLTIRVQKGFITDFASVPRIFWSIFPPFGRYTKAAVLHDRLCEAFLQKESWGILYNNNSKELVKRNEADKIFLEAMEAIGVKRSTRNILYFFVRAYAIFKYGYNA